MTNTYQHALKQFNKLPHVNNDQLDGTISHLVFRVQHELDILHEGEWNDDQEFTKAQQIKLREFIALWGTSYEIDRMVQDTPGIIKHRKVT